MKKRFGKIRSSSNKTLELDITSLLDILVILLVFLLKSYNASDLKLDLIPNLMLPDSYARKLGNDAIIIQINKKRDIYLDNKLIGTTFHTGSVIRVLQDKLNSIKKVREEEEAKVAELKEKKPPNRKINIVMDKDLPYSELQKIMHTSALSGFPEFKLIVKGNSE